MLKQIYRRMKRASLATRRPEAKVSFSQCGEDLMIDFLFRMKDIPRPTYLDIGAHHPFRLSNTAIFYERGSHGINVEANPRLWENFRKHRRRDINLNIGVGIEDGVMDFYVIEDDSLSTFSKEDADKLESMGQRVVKTERISVVGIQEVIDKHNNGIFPDLLSIDIEGHDLEVLRSINYDRSFPKVICVEITEYAVSGIGGRKTGLVDFLTSKGYFLYAQSNLNAIMAHRSFITDT